MGAHTLLNVALRYPERVAGIVVVTPAYSGETTAEAERLIRWDRLSQALRTGGIDAFVDAYDMHTLDPAFARTVAMVIRQRLSQHDNLDAVADALHAVPRSRPFGDLEELAAISVPAVVVASNDNADPEHPEAIGVAYAAAIPNARLVTDPPGSSPIAWRGSKLSQIIGDVAAASSLA
jgi:pimeloyl-ACP methyl ester carboxylesterase